jgi:hypothetical protein
MLRSLDARSLMGGLSEAIMPKSFGVSRLLLASGLGLLWPLSLACGGQEQRVEILLAEQDQSAQSGTTTLTPKGDQTEVVLNVNIGPLASDPQPVHIHFGTCGANLGSVAFPLNDVIAGKSTTLVDIEMESIRDGNHAINLHKSYPELRIYTACGNISES